ncbi:MAG: outer membrane beta-barrel protein [Chitinophagales bacterium]|nr:outer membrane beta-barrel protein [Chitinophagales bacterium]
MKKALLLSVFVFSILFVAAQKTGTVKGVVFDTLTQKPVAGATITVMKRIDSSLVTFTMTGNNGAFSLSGIEKGDYRLLITHVGYHNGNKYFILSDSVNLVDMGNVVLNDKTKVLEEVVIMAEAPPVTIVGDTIQYNAGSFKTKPNAVVEDLLKKLPGVQVESDGTVKAQGEEVKKILVDGKEFFGNDPKIATKNLPADAVDKVQVYDKKSDAAELTGFDDGNYEKTINLKLKEDKKKGAFGKAMVGGGTEGRYEGRFNVNAFKGARQLSVIGMSNNDNAEGFSFMDILNFSGGLGNVSSSGGNININISSSDPSANLFGLGGDNSINTTNAGGVNYNNIIGKKTKLNGNYFYNRFNPLTESRTARQYILPDSTNYYNSFGKSDVLNENHRVNFVVDYFIDSNNSIKITPNFSYQKSSTRSQGQSETLTEQLARTNDSWTDYIASARGYNFTNDIIYRHRFSKRGRTLSLSLNSKLNENTGESDLESVNNFYKTSNLFRTDSVRQRSDLTNDQKGYTAKAVYTEPLGKSSLLELSASNSHTRSVSDKVTYDYNKGTDKYDQLNDLLTNNYENIYNTTVAGFRVRTQKRKFSYAYGLSWQKAALEGTIISGTKDSVIRQDFHNWLPNAQFKYQFSRFKNLSLNYRTFTTQPTASQLQPVPDVSNQLSIKLGNPNLEQEFAHSIQLSYTGVNPFKNKNLFAFVNFTTTANKIVNVNQRDSLGVDTTTYVNVDGVYNLNSNFHVGLPLKFMKANLNLDAGVQYSRGFQYSNGAKNEIRNTSIDPRVEITKVIKNKVDLSVFAGITLSRATYSLQSNLNNNYVTREWGGNIGWELPKNFYLSTDFEYRVNTQRAEGFNIKVPMWNAAISKQFLKFNRGELKLSVHDLLNKNQGIQRNTNANYIEDVSNTILRRFFMLSFTYSLNKMGANPPGGPGMNMRVIRR